MRWNLITPASELKPPTMAGHSASVHNGHMIIFGGLQKRSTIGQFSSSNDVWSFNTDRYVGSFFLHIIFLKCCLHFIFEFQTYL